MRASIASLREARAPAVASRGRVEGHEWRGLSAGWSVARTAPGAVAEPSADLDALGWHAAAIPGTAAGALRDAGLWRPGEAYDFDAEDWWFRVAFDAHAAADGEEVVLCLDGVATVSEVYLNGEPLLQSESMFERHRVDVGRGLCGTNELTICCRALAPLLRERRRPRARWRTRIVSDGNLRFFRTMLLGRAPGFAPGPAAVGPWRAVGLERRRGFALDELRLRPSVTDEEGARLAVDVRMRVLERERVQAVELELAGPTGVHRAPLAITEREDAIDAHGELAVPDAARWWPHTHGGPSLYCARLLVTTAAAESFTVDAGRVGFRTLAFSSSSQDAYNHRAQFSEDTQHPPHPLRPDSLETLERNGLDTHVNGVRIFARGAVWTPLDPIGLAPSHEELRAALQQARDAGMNMLRVPGTGVYEDPGFYDLCDELGVLVWQDFMFANFDYPIADEHFASRVRTEAEQVLDDLAGRPSVTVLCGNSEVEQQVAMLGLDPALGRGELFGELLPSLVRDSGADAAYLPSAPCGEGLPFRTDRGVANYYGVGGYRRPLEDARLADVRFAAECLAFSNVPDERAIEEMRLDAPGGLVVHDPRWKAGVPRDAGAGWDFEDVRDHYLKLLFELDPVELRSVDNERYLELSRAVTGEVMAEVFGEWRRAGSRCGGGLVLWLRDQLAGAGWGVIDHRGAPKAAYHHLRRALAPVAVWTTDEGLNGVAVHVANDRPQALRARLRVALYNDFERSVGEAQTDVRLAPHDSRTWDLEALLGYFVDASWSYRFGPPAQDVIVASLEEEEEESSLVSQAFRFPAGRPNAREPLSRLGLYASLESGDGGVLRVRVGSARLAYGVRLHAPRFTPAHDAFSVEPGGERVVELRPSAADATFADCYLSAINLQGSLRVEDAR